MELLTLILSILPLSLAASVSPTILAYSTVILSDQDKPKRKLYAFLAGAALVSVVFGLVEISATASLYIPSQDIRAHYSSYIDFALGIFLLLWGLKKLLTKPHEKHRRFTPENENAQTTRLMAFGGFSMATNFTTFIFYIAALKSINLGSESFPGRLLALAFINFFILLPIILPLFLYSVSPQTSQVFLGKVNDTFKRYGNAVTTLLLLIFGLYFIIKSLGYLV